MTLETSLSVISVLSRSFTPTEFPPNLLNNNSHRVNNFPVIIQYTEFFIKIFKNLKKKNLFNNFIIIEIHFDSFTLNKMFILFTIKNIFHSSPWWNLSKILSSPKSIWWKIKDNTILNSYLDFRTDFLPISQKNLFDFFPNLSIDSLSSSSFQK